MQIVEIPVNKLHDRDNNRENLGDIAGFATGIEEIGLIHAIEVKPDSVIPGDYTIVAGHRRYYAFIHLERVTIPCIVKSGLSPAQSYLITLAENNNRLETNDIEKARGYHHGIHNLGLDIEIIAKSDGRTKSYITRRLDLLSLRDDIIKTVSDGQLLIGYAHCMVNLDRNRQQMAMLALRDNTSPSVKWFKTICNELLSQQSQQTMTFGLFGDGSDMVIPETIKAVKPPEPAGFMPDFSPATINADIANQLIIWRQAYDDWQSLGKANKANQCQAIVTTLQSIAEVLPALAPIETKPADRIFNLIADHQSLTTRAIYQLGNINKAQWLEVKSNLLENGRIVETASGRGYRYSIAS